MPRRRKPIRNMAEAEAIAERVIPTLSTWATPTRDCRDAVRLIQFLLEQLDNHNRRESGTTWRERTGR